MCGIAGVVSPHLSAGDLQAVDKMVHALLHRGPDGNATAEVAGGVFGHTRLAVIDLDQSANQPMQDASGRYLIVYNGELYNFRALRRELSEYPFRTNSDTEVILAAFAKWGEQCLDRFNGMFAFAIWDTQNHDLFLARDRLGEKPLYWATTADGAFAFASEPQALTRHPGITKTLDPNGLGMFLQLNYTVGQQTLYSGIHRFPAAHCGWVRRGQDSPSQTCYWDLASHFHNKRRDLSPLSAALELAELLDDAVASRLVSDVPVGAFLSGGLDSSAITASMARTIGPGHTKTFSIGFDDASFDELDYAQSVADHLDVDHHPATIDRDLPRLIEQLDIATREPLADTSFLPMLLLSEVTRKQVTVALSGDGADEIFLGYPTYNADVLHRWSSPLLRPLQPTLTKLVDKLPVSFAKVSFDYKARQWVSGLNLNPTDAHGHWREIFAQTQARQVLSDDVLQTIDFGASSRASAQHLAEVGGCHYLDQASYVDIKTWLPDDILVKVDRATMAHSLEARAPFLDHRIVEFAASLPVNHKLNLGVGKRVLRTAQRHRLPSVTLQRSKRGFNAPVSAWFNGPLKEKVYDTLHHAALDSLINRVYLDRIMNEHTNNETDHGLKLLSLYSLSRWLQD